MGLSQNFPNGAAEGNPPASSFGWPLDEWHRIGHATAGGDTKKR